MTGGREQDTAGKGDNMTDEIRKTVSSDTGETSSPQERYIGNLLLPLVILSLAAVCLVQTFDFPGGDGDVGPAGVPYLWIGFTALFCIMLIVEAILHKMPPDPKPGRIGFVILFVGWLAVYLIAIQNIGYYVSTFVFLTVSMFVLGYRNYVIMAVIAIIWLVFAYLVFARLLYIQLPQGPVMQMFF